MISWSRGCKVEVMDDEEFVVYMQEEVQEFLESDEIEELMDVYEVK